MAVYKNEDRGTYFCSFYYTDWTGKKKKKKRKKDLKGKKMPRIMKESF